MENRILFLDDEEPAHISFRAEISKLYPSSQVKYCFNKQDVEVAIKNEYFDVFFLDQRLKEGQLGTEIAKTIKNKQPNSYIVMATAFGLESAEDAIRARVFSDFISKSENDEFRALELVMARYEAYKKEEKKRIEAEKRAEKAEAKVFEQNSIIADLQKDFNVDISSYTDNSSPLKGNSEKMKNIRWFIDVYATTEIPVLLLGETGTGKELVAKEIHKKSNRKSHAENPLTINCGAIPETLIESELFGYKKGSHSEAKKDKDGAFKTVGKGTLFLDEFADLSINAQVKVLRAIAEKKFKPIGADKDEDFEGRVICATSQDFKELIGNKYFRSDLLNRVNSLFPKMPSLSERKEDIYDIVFLHLKEKLGRENDLPVTPDGIAALRDSDYNWPGNIRELLFFIDNILTVFPKTKIDKEKVLKLLNLWKTHQADIGLLNDHYDSRVQKSRRDNIIENDNLKSGKIILSANDKYNMKTFLIKFKTEYLKYEEDNGKYPKQQDIEPILEPLNNLGWLSSRFTKSKEPKNCQLAKEVIDENTDLQLLKQIAPFKKLFH